ncbi:MAG TPA: glucose-6-phosphate dehydrogenase [Phycisphaerales bacterium]|nr:glucose-6-phosphate dehydrogenase [Phycisphaerales bacterium]
MNRGYPDRQLIIIFGATGDLSHRKLIPALWEIERHSPAKGRATILGVARAGISDDEFRAQVVDAMKKAGEDSPEIEQWAKRSIYFQSLGDQSEYAYQALRVRIEAIEKSLELPGNRVFYLALPLPAFPPTVESLGAVGLNNGPGWTRVVIEKPFGHDLDSARSLNALLHRFYAEENVFRLDHYLGKETVQNLLAFRFGNALWEPIWNRDRISHVEITAAEELGVEARGSFYEKAGAVRDIIQNHLLQVLGLVAMDAPAGLDGTSVSNEKLKVLRSIAPLRPEDFILGQYAEGEAGGKRLTGYRDEPGVSKDSKTETFAAVKFSINSWRWEGVPFYLRTGKRMAKKTTKIVVTFKCPPAAVFNPYIVCGNESNRLIITLQPNEGFNLSFQVKIPGEGMRLHTQDMRFRYADEFGKLPEAYQTLLLDVMRGDHTLFVRNDEVEQAWKVCEPLIDPGNQLHPYAAGTWGPTSSERLVEREGHSWVNI